MVLMAETAIPKDAKSYFRGEKDVGLTHAEKQAIRDFEKNGRRVHGQTPDDLRQAGLKIVSGALQQAIHAQGGYWSDFRVFTNEPRHLIRSIRPSCSDIIFGERLGALAVDGAMAGYSDFMISQWLTEYVMVPLPLVILGRKRIPTNGVFWKSVIAKTGQPAGLIKP
jgi:6-phosphofructokinase